jgi:dipeptidyl aminopeptidase/acylaminoacyl peptidase
VALNTLPRRQAIEFLLIALSLPIIWFMLVRPIPAGAQQTAQAPLQAEALIKEVELMPYESLLPSPDGKWVAYEAGDPTKPIQFDYEGQRFTKSGFPMLSSALAFSVWVSEVGAGKNIQLESPQGSSWNPSWSPDSRYLAFYSDRGGQAALWIWDRETKTTKQISNVFIHTSWWRERPVWSADGKTVLCKILPEGLSLEDVLKIAPFYREALEPKTTKVELQKGPSVHVYASHPGEAQVKPAAAESQPANTDQVENAEFMDSSYLSDIARIDIATGKATRILKRVRPMWFAYSPDEQTLAILNMEGNVPRTQQIVYNVNLFSFRDQSVKTLAKGFFDANNLTTRVTWSPDGTRLAYSDTGKTAERAAYVINVKTGEKEKVSAKIPSTPLNFEWGPPFWSKDSKFVFLVDSAAGKIWEVNGSGAAGEHTRDVTNASGVSVRDMAVDETTSTYWSPDGGVTMYFRAHDESSKKDALYSVNVQSGETKKLHEGDESIGMREMGSLVGVRQGSGGNSGTLIYSSESASRPTDLWCLDLSTQQPKALSDLNPQYDGVPFGKIQIIEWLSLQGEHLRGALLLPSNYQAGQRYPLIVFVYGGDMGSDKANRFAFGWGGAFNPQMWATRGFATLYPDVPLHPGTPVDDLVSAVIPGVNKAAELGIADPDRMAMMGQSFGGYNTVAMITRTNIFKAAVAMSVPATDLTYGYTQFQGGTAPWMGYYEEGQGGMRGSPWDFKERYYVNSPIFFLDRVQTPLLIERGALDAISASSGTVFASLQRLGKEAEFLEYDHEEHVLQQPANVVDFWNRRIEWVNRYFQRAKESRSSVPTSK